MNYDPQILKSQQDFVCAVDKHGMPIDFAGEEPQEAETPAERAALIALITIAALCCLAAIAVGIN